MIVSRHYSEPSERKYIFERIQDVEPILELNKARQTTPQSGDWGRHVGSIPLVIIERWLHEEWERGNVSLKPWGKEMDALIARKLRDPDWRWLRADK